MLNLVLMALLMFGPAPANKPWRAPHVVSQRSVMVIPQYESPQWEAHIFIHNPMKKAVWVWLDCRPHFTSVAIGIQAAHMSEYVFPDIPPGENCNVDHWEYQRPGHQPAEWTP